MRRARRLAVLACTLLLSGCVYYNGVYNAQRLASQGDARLRRGDENDAENRFRQSAEAAESVLVQFPTSKWRPRARSRSAASVFGSARNAFKRGMAAVQLLPKAALRPAR